MTSIETAGLAPLASLIMDGGSVGVAKGEFAVILSRDEQRALMRPSMVG